MTNTNLFRRVLIITTLVILSHLLNCQNDVSRYDENTLAIIGRKAIGIEDFSNRLKELKRRTGINDNLQLRRNLLNNFISEELLIHEARRREYDKDSEGIYEFERIKIQELLNSYHRKFINKRITVSEEELYQLYIRLNTKLNARHLFAPTLQQADSLYHELHQGKTFEELAKNIFQDPVLKNSGGQLGYFTVDEMEPAFEEAAYELKIGEISKPVKTSDGYSIIRVDDRIVKPLLTEYEYAKHRGKLRHYMERRKMKKASQNHVDSLKKALHVSFNDQTVHELLLAIQEWEKQDKTIEKEPLGAELKDLNDKILVYSDLGSWTVELFQQYAKFTSTTQHKWIRTAENLKDFISGLIVRSYILSKAREYNLDDAQPYQEQVNRKFDEYLLERINEYLYEEIVVPEDSLKRYFDEDPLRFALPPEVNLREIILDDEDIASLITSKLNKNMSFSELARKYSVRRWSAENGGELGFLAPSDLGRWSSLAFSLKIGEWTGPIKMESYWVFLQCIGKKQSELRTFELARKEVEETLRAMYWKKYQLSKVGEIREHVNVKSYPEKLMKIVIK